MNYRVLLLACTVTILGSCGSTKGLIAEDFNLTLDKGACFGSCPVYTLSIDNEGNAIYEGKRFTDKSGIHKKKLSKQVLQKLAKQLNDSNFFSFLEQYRSDIADLPLIEVSHTNKGLSKSVKGKNTRPKSLIEIQKSLEDIANQDGWIAVEPALSSTQEEEPEEEEEEKEVIEREIIIKFKSNTIVSRWMAGYREYQMYVQKPLTADKKTWIVQYNPKLIDPTILLQKVQNDSGVESAEFNTKSESR